MTDACYYIGIDPGKSGGIAWIKDNVLHCVPMPASYSRVLDILEPLYPGYALIEKILPQAFPGTGKGSIAKLYGSYCSLQMACTAFDIQYNSLLGRKWQSLLNVPTSPTRKKRKRKLKLLASTLYPEIKVTLKTADAILLAHLCAMQSGLF